MTSIFIVAKNEFITSNLENEGIHLFAHIDNISSIGEEFSIQRLDECVYTPTESIAEFLCEAGATEEEISMSNPELWIPAQTGFQLLNEYIKIVTDYHSLSEKTKSLILPELTNFSAILDVLCADGNEWHFEYDI